MGISGLSLPFDELEELEDDLLEDFLTTGGSSIFSIGLSNPSSGSFTSLEDELEDDEPDLLPFFFGEIRKEKVRSIEETISEERPTGMPKQQWR